jgi:hypothetical protein
MAGPLVRLVTRAPLRATRRQLYDLCDALPELGRIDNDLLELALDLIPICVLAWRPIEQAHAIARELSDLDILVLDIHALHRLQLDCPSRADSLLEACFAPSFHPCAVIRATYATTPAGGIELHIHTAREPPDTFPLAIRMLHGLDLDGLPDVEVVRDSGLLDARASRRLLDAIAALRAHPDPEETGPGIDGMDVELRLPDDRGGTLVIQRWSPEPNEAPRMHATLLALLDACALLPLAPELGRAIADLRRYL